MFGEGIIVGLILGKVSGGRFANLGRLNIRAWPFIFLAFVLQIYPMFVGKAAFVQKIQFYSYGVSYLLLFFCVILNLNQKGIWLILIGAIMNAVVIFANKMHMPISFQGLEMAGLQEMMNSIREGKILYHISLEEARNWTRLLGKYIVIPKPYPFARVLSIGDLFMTLGLILWIRGRMVQSIFSRRAEMLKFRYKR